jgi:NAD(P)-dependent dehydrogenase (short-subunit alcohol dehydrogenase family)
VSAYSASKGALISASRVVASELSKRNIRVNCISPGTVLTPMMENFLKGLSEADYNKRLGAFPLGVGKTSDVSYACIYLLSDASRWVTGQNLIIDGGYTMM